MRKFSAILGTLLLFGSGASASLIGDEVTILIESESGTPIVSSTVIGGAAASMFVVGDLVYSVQVLEASILFNVNYTGTGTGIVGPLTFTASDLDWLPDPGTLADVNVVSDLLASPQLVSFTDDSVSFPGIAVAFPPSVTVLTEITLEVSHDEVPMVPEPATVSLTGLGFALLLVRKRRRP